MLTNPTDPALTGAIMLYAMDVYNHIRDMPWNDVMTLSKAADQVLLEHPLVRDKNGEFPKFDLPTYNEPQSIVYCLALVSAVLVWSQKVLADNELPSSPFLDAANMGLKLWQLKPNSPPSKKVEAENIIQKVVSSKPRKVTKKKNK